MSTVVQDVTRDTDRRLTETSFYIPDIPIYNSHEELTFDHQIMILSN